MLTLEQKGRAIVKLVLRRLINESKSDLHKMEKSSKQLVIINKGIW